MVNKKRMKKLNQTLAPLINSWFANALPRPWPDPVMIATFPWKYQIFFLNPFFKISFWQLKINLKFPSGHFLLFCGLRFSYIFFVLFVLYRLNPGDTSTLSSVTRRICGYWLYKCTLMKPKPVSSFHCCCCYCISAKIDIEKLYLLLTTCTHIWHSSRGCDSYYFRNSPQNPFHL